MTVQPVLWFGVVDRHGELFAVEEGKETAKAMCDYMNRDAKKPRYQVVPVAVLPPEIGAAVLDVATLEAGR